MNKIYLAHPIRDREWVRKLEIKLEKELGIELLNPFYDGPERQDIVDIDMGKVMEYAATLDEDKIVNNDLKLIDKSDGTLAILTNKKTIGTIMEIMYSKMTKKTVWIICTDPELIGHPWLRWASDDKIFKRPIDWKRHFKEKHLVHTTEH